MSSDEIDFNDHDKESDEKIEFDWSDRDLDRRLIPRSIVYKLKRRIRLDAYKIGKDSYNIRICVTCGKSNLKLEKVDRTGKIEAYLNKCTYCGGPALQYRSRPFSVNYFDRYEQESSDGFYRQAECLDCGHSLQRDEVEAKLSELEPAEVKEVEFEVIERSLRGVLIDSHHLQYKDRHGREVTIPLCKDCHNEEQRGVYPGISPENIDVQDAIIFDEQDDLEKRGS